MTDLPAVSDKQSDTGGPGPEDQQCRHCGKPVRRAAEQRWVHTESDVHPCEPGRLGSTNTFVFPEGMRLVRRTRTTVLGPDGPHPA